MDSNFTAEHDSALFFIAKNQLPSGGFNSYSGDELQSTPSAAPYSALIGSILLPLAKHEQTKTILENLTRFLKNQTESDLSTTSLSTGIISNTEDTLRLELAAAFTLQLTKQELKPGGPYYSWSKPLETPPSDLDPVTNASIHFALQIFGVHLPTLESYLVNCIKNNRWRSQHYASTWLNFYLIWRTLSWESQQKLTKEKDNFKNEPITSKLDQACYTLVTRDTSNLENGSITFAPDPAMIEKSSQNKQIISGAPALTAALWALLYYTFEEKLEPDQDKAPYQIRDRVTQTVARKFTGLSPELAERGIHHLSLLLAEPISLEVMLLSRDFAKALGMSVPEHLEVTLGAANVFGWLAFTLYDECFDENKITIDISLANICLRLATNLYTEAADYLKVDSTLILQALNHIDEAQARDLSDTLELREALDKKKRWIGTTLRQVTERSFGHCLGPLILGKAANVSTDFFHNLKKLFNSYLTARQICDDLHDWPSDFSAKRVTTVTKNLFFTTQAFPGIDLFQAKKIFWHEGLELSVQRARQEIATAKHLLNRLHWPKHKPIILEQSIVRLESTINQALAERKGMKDFISNFKNYESV